MIKKPFTLTSVKPEARSVLGISFEDGADFKVDLKPIMRKHPTLERLADPAVFSTARVGDWGGSVIWAQDDQLELAAENLRARAIEQAGGYSHEFIWNWMAGHEMNVEAAAEALGLSSRALVSYRRGIKPVPRIVALACLGWEAEATFRKRSSGNLKLTVDLDPAQAQGLSGEEGQDLTLPMKEDVAAVLTVRPQRRGAARDPLVGEVDRNLVNMKRARLEGQTLRAIRHGTEWLTAAEIAEHADLGSANPTKTVSRWKQRGRVFALRQGSKDYFPRYALGTDFQPLPVMKEILAVLAGYAPELLAGWFDSTSRLLGGKRPRELVATEPGRVVATARNMIEVQEHHG